MALRKKKEISSTEKLLDVIRNKKTPDQFLESPDFTPSKKSKKLPFLKTSHEGKAISVGVDIGYHQLRFIKVIQTPDNRWRLLDYSTVPFSPDIPRGAPEFVIFLRAELDKFCGSSSRKGLNLWANMSSARVEVSAVRIPKVAKKQIENAVYWTVKKNISFNEKETIFDFEVQNEVIESGVTKLAVMACAAPKQEVLEMRDLFENAGYPLDGLTIAPFAIQNLFRTNWIPSFEQTVATLYIGRDWSRIDIFSKGVLVMTRGIKAGINSMVQELMESYNEGILPEEWQLAEVSEVADTGKNIVMETRDARELLFSLSPDSPPSTDLRIHFGLDENSIFRKINPALDRLVRQVERTFQHYTVTLGNENVSAIYVSITQNIYRPIVDYIGGELGIESDVLDPLGPENPSVGEMMSDISVSDRVSFGPVLGVALSDLSRTTNLLYTFKEKEKQSSISMLNRVIFAGLAVVLAFCLVTLIWLGHSVDHKKTMIANLEQQLSQTVSVNDQIMSQLVSKIKQNQKRLKRYSDRYLGVAAISELSALTPSNIRILHINADMGLASVGGGKKAADGLTIEGIVSGDIRSLESSLVGYVLKLQSSPMFNQAKISMSKIEPFGNKEVLRFTLNVKFI